MEREMCFLSTLLWYAITIFVFQQTKQMKELLLKAIVTGLILSLMIGPALFLLLETSIKKGIKAALSFDLGILLSDLLYIFIAYVFYAQVSHLVEGKHTSLLKGIGGSLFFIYGLISFLKKSKVQSHEEIDGLTSSTKDYFLQFLKGFLLNLANPMVIFYWFSVMAIGTQNGASDLSENLLFIGVLLSVFFSIDILKIIGAKKLRPFITDAFLHSLNRITGSILMLFGLVLLLQGIFEKM
jgi:threonine/homoserine/homoserine lactone efflux protein